MITSRAVTHLVSCHIDHHRGPEFAGHKALRPIYRMTLETQILGSLKVCNGIYLNHL